MAITRCGNFYGGGDFNWNRIVPGTSAPCFAGDGPSFGRMECSCATIFYVEDGAAAYMLLAEKLAETIPGRRRRSISPTKSP